MDYPKQPLPFTQRSLKDDLTSCGITEGANLIIHCSLKSIGYVVGGVEALLYALLDVIGDSGTLVVPTQSWKNLDPCTGVHGVPKAWWDVIRENYPAYNRDVTPSLNMGALAELIRTHPKAKRSQHPARSFAAVGANAEAIIADHLLESPTGEQSPLSKLYELDGQVFLLGVGHDKSTSLHLAEDRASYDNKSYITESSAIMKDGQRHWVSYHILEPISDDFNEVGMAFEAQNKVRFGKVGNAETRLMSQRELVDFASVWMSAHR
ncbi:aminoglycoside N(3)-acetyltransferase [Pleurocapsa sp. PCC 7319]|uniref:aminoglycoside N(3)-acetyltransferase n=1 Tax=Pleurocapsa sp. PCC 7319 TaxID=118161 RepID=UPI0003451DB2|nr:AAC(3) family N-acetyltransferase [Pleurocapsa sp. PCC 7319]